MRNTPHTIRTLHMTAAACKPAFAHRGGGPLAFLFPSLLYLFNRAVSAFESTAGQPSSSALVSSRHEVDQKAPTRPLL